VIGLRPKPIRQSIAKVRPAAGSPVNIDGKNIEFTKAIRASICRSCLIYSAVFPIAIPFAALFRICFTSRASAERRKNAPSRRVDSSTAYCQGVNRQPLDRPMCHPIEPRHSLGATAILEVVGSAICSGIGNSGAIQDKHRAVPADQAQSPGPPAVLMSCRERSLTSMPRPSV
jgi:hypothetical protein